MFNEIDKVIVGQDEALKQVAVALVSDAHAVLEGYPGVAKTLAIKTFAQLLDLKFSRIQNTPDLMPSDITGTYIIEETAAGKRQFKFQPGPVFANVVLADEINRATPKTQSALLEAMQERQVTVGTTTFKLDEPFFVLATQNPIEQEGSLALSQTVFVNGSLKTGAELLNAAAEKCVAEDSKGIRLYDIDAWTYSLNTSGRLGRHACMLYTLPYDGELITVTTRAGRKIKVTKNHPFLVNDMGAICWKKAEELTRHDYLVQPARLPLMPAASVMSHDEAVTRMTQKPIDELPFDDDFAFWIAFLLSDGSIGDKYVEAVQKNYPKELDRWIALSQKYGFKVAVRDHRGVRYAKIYSKPLVEYLHVKFGIKGGRDKEIPSWFLSLPASMNREFVKTFIALESSLRDNRIVFTQKSANNVNIIAHMLLREGITSWIRHDGRIFRLKIQGKDIAAYLKAIGWFESDKVAKVSMKKCRSSFRVVPVERFKVLRLVELLGLNSFHTLPERKSLISRNWYGSYKGIKEGETVMSVDALQNMVDDIRSEVQTRRLPDFAKLHDTNPRRFAASIGLPITDVAAELHISKNQVWQLYTHGGCTETVQIHSFLQEQFQLRMAETEQLLHYFERLLSEDVFYDQIKSIEYSESEGLAFGLTVPESQNYLAGFGSCGINHNTYPLPEAQADRFLLKIRVGYPNFDQEMEIVNRYAEAAKKVQLKPVLGKEQLFAVQALARQIPIANDLKKYAINLVTSTRQKKDLIEYGASPRASIGLVLASKAKALIEGRKYVSKEDINSLAYPVLRHRIILSFEAERQNMHEDDVIKGLLK